MGLEEDWATLLKWMDEEHGWNSSELQVEWKDVPGAGRGLFTTNDISPDTTLLKLPPSCLLHPRNIYAQHADGLPLEVFPRDVVPKSVLAPSTTSAVNGTASAVKNVNGTKVQHKLGKKGHPVGPAASSSPSSIATSKTKTSNTPASTSDISLQLTTTQTLTLYLSLYRDRQSPSGPGSDTPTSPWTPYFRTLPDSFRDWHPLTWLISPSAGRRKLFESSLIPDMPVDDIYWQHLNALARDHVTPRAGRSLRDVLRRYERDKERICMVIERVLEKAAGDELGLWRKAWETVEEEDFLWGWLNVNSRTFFLPLNIPSPSSSSSSIPRPSTYKTQKEDLDAEQQNHTMAPVLDFANHCHTDYDRACMAGNIVFAPPRVKSSVKSAWETNGKKGKILSRDGGSASPLQKGKEQKAASSGLTKEQLFHDPSIRILSDGKAITDNPWTARSLRLIGPRRREAEDIDMDKDDADGRENQIWLKKGEEVFFAYGGHDDETLFAEYGFVPYHPDIESADGATFAGDDDWFGKGVEPGGNPHAMVAVDDLMEKQWLDLDPSELKAKKELLEMQGYFGDYAFYSHPAPASPSHRVITTLRLLHTPIPSSSINDYIAQPYFPAGSYNQLLADWMDTLSGEQECMSDEIEGKVRGSVRKLCEELEEGARAGERAVREWQEGLCEEVDSGVKEGAEAVLRLWANAERVARLVRENLGGR